MKFTPNNPKKLPHKQMQCLLFRQQLVFRQLDLKDYGPENNRGCRYVLVVNDIFNKYGWTNPFKKCSNKIRLFRKHTYNFKKKTKLNLD